MTTSNYWESQDNAAQSGNRTLVDERDELRRTNEGLRLTFDLRWKADQRAIKRWQAAHPGNDLTWPDHADMVVWLMEQFSENVKEHTTPTKRSLTTMQTENQNQSQETLKTGELVGVDVPRLVRLSLFKGGDK